LHHVCYEIDYLESGYARHGVRPCDRD
jgi:hypothetical protein